VKTGVYDLLFRLWPSSYSYEFVKHLSGVRKLHSVFPSSISSNPPFYIFIKWIKFGMSEIHLYLSFTYNHLYIKKRGYLVIFLLDIDSRCFRY